MCWGRMPMAFLTPMISFSETRDLLMFSSSTPAVGFGIFTKNWPNREWPDGGATWGSLKCTPPIYSMWTGPPTMFTMPTAMSGPALSMKDTAGISRSSGHLSWCAQALPAHSAMEWSHGPAMWVEAGADWCRNPKFRCKWGCRAWLTPTPTSAVLQGATPSTLSFTAAGCSMESFSPSIARTRRKPSLLSLYSCPTAPKTGCEKRLSCVISWCHISTTWPSKITSTALRWWSRFFLRSTTRKPSNMTRPTFGENRC